MAFNDFTYRVRVNADNKEISEYCNRTFAIGHWGIMFGITGTSSTYCFEYENDALMFILRWPTA